MKSSVPDGRVRAVNALPENPDGLYVLYWMTANRRARYNFALQHAVDHAERLGLPLLVVEALRADYPWASARFHRFIMDGMIDNDRAFARSAAVYHPTIEREPGDGKGMLEALAGHAAVVVGDDSPAFFLPTMVAAAARAARARVEVVDSNGLFPLRATSRVFTTAVSFRRHLQKELSPHLLDIPRKNPLARRRLEPLSALPSVITERWPAVGRDALRDDAWLRGLPIDQSVAPCSPRGGARTAGKTLRRFVDDRLGAYATRRNQPSADCQSHLAPYLHFGHISAHEVFLAVTDQDGWSPERIAERVTGSRQGWWGASEPVEAFLDQLVTWRELGYNAAAHQPDYMRYESLPTWARLTLETHRGDHRPVLYSEGELDAGDTHDPIWNAAQIQLRTEGTIHNYLRMLWGKKILEWTPDPQAALAVMIELNNKYALDGRDPNSYSGIFWVLGRYDRAWGPERPIFGKVRYMSSDNTRRKLSLGDYMERHRPPGRSA